MFKGQWVTFLGWPEVTWGHEHLFANNFGLNHDRELKRVPLCFFHQDVSYDMHLDPLIWTWATLTFSCPEGIKLNLAKIGQNGYISNRLVERNTLVIKSFVYYYFERSYSMSKITGILLTFGDLWSLNRWPEVKSETIRQKEHSKSYPVLFEILL